MDNIKTALYNLHQKHGAKFVPFAGYQMPIYSDHWLYKYMTDGDGDGAVGE